MREAGLKPEWGARIALLMAMAVAAAAILWLQRGLTYASDALLWFDILGSRPLSYVLHPYNGHLIVAPLLVFRGLLELGGTAYLPFRLLDVALVLTLGGLIFEYSRRRVGPVLALAPAIVVLGLGSGWTQYLEPMIGIQWLLAIVPGLAALLILERPGRRLSVLACLMLCLSLSSSSVGFAFLIGAVISVALRDDRRSRAWIATVPLLLYLLWRLCALQFGGTGIAPANVLLVPAYFADSAAVMAASLFGRGGIVGPGEWARIHLTGWDSTLLLKAVLYTAAEVALVAVAIRWLRRMGPVPPTLWVALGVLATLWFTQALTLSSDRTPGEIRYLLPGTVALLLVVVEVFRGVRAGRLVTAGVLALAVVAVVANAPRFADGRQVLTDYATQARADLAVIELVGHRAPPGFNPAEDAPGVAPPALTLRVGEYLEAAARFGSLALPVAGLRDQDADVRDRAGALGARLLGRRGRCFSAMPWCQ